MKESINRLQTQARADVLKLRDEQDKFKDMLSNILSDFDQVTISKIQRQKSDTDLRITQLKTALEELTKRFNASATDNDALASAVAMLVENVNMQIEAEC